MKTIHQDLDRYQARGQTRHYVPVGAFLTQNWSFASDGVRNQMSLRMLMATLKRARRDTRSVSYPPRKQKS